MKVNQKKFLEFPFRFGDQTLPFWQPIPRNPDGPYPSARQAGKRQAGRRAAASARPAGRQARGSRHRRPFCVYTPQALQYQSFPEFRVFALVRHLRQAPRYLDPFLRKRWSNAFFPQNPDGPHATTIPRKGALKLPRFRVQFFLNCFGFKMS